MEHQQANLYLEGKFQLNIIQLFKYEFVLSLYIYFLCSASVTAVFLLDGEDGKEISFQRSVQGSSSEYRINGNVSFLL